MNIKVECDIADNNLSWRDKEIRTSIGEKIAENVSMMNTRKCYKINASHGQCQIFIFD